MTQGLQPLPIRGDRLLMALEALEQWQKHTIGRSEDPIRTRIAAIIAQCTGDRVTVLHNSYSFHLHVGHQLRWLAPTLRSITRIDAIEMNVAELNHFIRSHSGWDLTTFFRRIACGEITRTDLFGPSLEQSP